MSENLHQAGDHPTRVPVFGGEPPQVNEFFSLTELDREHRLAVLPGQGFSEARESELLAAELKIDLDPNGLSRGALGRERTPRCSMTR